MRLIIIVIFIALHWQTQCINIFRDAETEDFLNELIAPLLKQGYNTNIQDYTTNIGNLKEPQIGRFKTYSTYTKPIPVYNFTNTREPSASTNDGLTLKRKSNNGTKITIQFYLVDSPAINAFVAGGQNIFVYTGLIAAYNNTNMLRGVLAHELGHVIKMHLLRSQINANQVKKDAAIGTAAITLLSIAGGAGGVASGIAGLGAGGNIATDGSFAFSRTLENEADTEGIRYLDYSGFTARGILDLMEYFTSKTGDVGQMQSYFQTHPLPKDRLAKFKHYVENEDKFRMHTDIKLEEKFQRVRAKIVGYYGNNFPSINTPYSAMPQQLDKDRDFFTQYQNLYTKFRAAEYNYVISHASQLKRNDTYLNEILAQSHCVLKQINEAKYYFNQIINKDNYVIQYEYAECLLKYGVDNDFKLGLEYADSMRKKYKNNAQIRLLIAQAASEKEMYDLQYLALAENALIEDNTSGAKENIAKALEEVYKNPSSQYANEIRDIANILEVQ